jgi:hypothetical protein
VDTEILHAPQWLNVDTTPRATTAFLNRLLPVFTGYHLFNACADLKSSIQSPFSVSWPLLCMISCHTCHTSSSILPTEYLFLPTHRHIFKHVISILASYVFCMYSLIYLFCLIPSVQLRPNTYHQCTIFLLSRYQFVATIFRHQFRILPTCCTKLVSYYLRIRV